MNSLPTLCVYDTERLNNDVKVLETLGKMFPESGIIKYTPYLLQLANAMQTIQDSSFTGEAIAHVKGNVVSVESRGHYPNIKPIEDGEVIE